MDTDEYEYETDTTVAQEAFVAFRKMVEDYTTRRRRYLYIVPDAYSPVAFRVHYSVNRNCRVLVCLNSTDGARIDISPCPGGGFFTQDISTEEKREQAFECICKLMPKCLSSICWEMQNSGFTVSWPGNYIDTVSSQEMSIRHNQRRDWISIFWLGPVADRLEISYMYSDREIDKKSFNSSQTSAVILAITKWFTREQ